MFSLFLIAIALAMDAFAVSVINGSQYIQTYAPYITFAILVYLGIDMIRDAENEDGNGLDTKTLLLSLF